MVCEVEPSSACDVYGVKEDPYDVTEGPFFEAVKTGGYAAGYFGRLGDFLMDQFYFPLNQKPLEPFYKDTEEDLSRFMECLKGETEHIDRTFPEIEKVIGKFEVRDIPIEIRVDEKIFRFSIRIVESKNEYFDRKIRFLLFSFYGNLDGEKPWAPKSVNEITGAVFELIKNLQKTYSINSLITFSIGNLVLDGLKNLDVEKANEILPEMLFINRGLPSIEKVSKILFPDPFVGWVPKILEGWIPDPRRVVLYYSAQFLGLDGNPELELLNFFDRLSKSPSSSIESRKVTLIEMKYDSYFSGSGAFDPDYHEKLKALGPEVNRATFSIPAVHTSAHHAAAMHQIPVSGAGSKVDGFPSEEGENLSNLLMKKDLLPHKSGESTHMFIGGNKDTLDSIMRLQVAPLLVSFTDFADTHRIPK